MRFTIENVTGKPVIRATGGTPFVARDLEELHKAVKVQATMTQDEAHWVGVACILFATLALEKWGNRLDETNLLKTLDEFYFSFSDMLVNRAFQRGLRAGIECVHGLVENRREDDAVNILAAKLGY